MDAGILSLIRNDNQQLNFKKLVDADPGLIFDQFKELFQDPEVFKSSILLIPSEKTEALLESVQAEAWSFSSCTVVLDAFADWKSFPELNQHDPPSYLIVVVRLKSTSLKHSY